MIKRVVRKGEFLFLELPPNGPRPQYETRIYDAYVCATSRNEETAFSS